jgi:rhodanese-related sulfurtransferase
MDQTSRFSISALELSTKIGVATAPLIIDVRAPEDYHRDNAKIVGAVRRVPADTFLWRDMLDKDRRAVLYCADGTASANLAAALIEIGIEARFLAGGIDEWRRHGLPTCRKPGIYPSQWVTRERPKVDRIACPWLIHRFIDPEAVFYYVRPDNVRDFAAWSGAIPYDIEGAEFGHAGAHCSFDAFLRIYDIHDPALDHLALIVRGADTGQPALAPQSPGLIALSQGLSATIARDHQQLEHGVVMYDALYAWCRNEVGARV